MQIYFPLLIFIKSANISGEHCIAHMHVLKHLKRSPLYQQLQLQSLNQAAEHQCLCLIID